MQEIDLTVLRDARRMLEVAARRLRKLEQMADEHASYKARTIFSEAITNIRAACARLDV